MSDTPRTDACYAEAYKGRDGEWHTLTPDAKAWDFARRLERELNARSEAVERDAADLEAAWLDGFIDGAYCYDESAKPFKYSDQCWGKSDTKKKVDAMSAQSVSPRAGQESPTNLGKLLLDAADRGFIKPSPPGDGGEDGGTK